MFERVNPPLIWDGLYKPGKLIRAGGKHWLFAQVSNKWSIAAEKEPLERLNDFVEGKHAFDEYDLAVLTYRDEWDKPARLKNFTPIRNYNIGKVKPGAFVQTEAGGLYLTVATRSENVFYALSLKELETYDLTYLRLRAKRYQDFKTMLKAMRVRSATL